MRLVQTGTFLWARTSALAFALAQGSLRQDCEVAQEGRGEAESCKYIINPRMCSAHEAGFPDKIFKWNITSDI